MTIGHQMSDFQTKLASVIAKAAPEFDTYSIFYSQGSDPPPLNHLDVSATFDRFCSVFLPQCPITDPRGRIVKIRKDNFPKFLNLEVRQGLFPKKASTIVAELENGRLDEGQYTFAKDRIQALFWVPDVVRAPDAIFKVKKDHGGLVKANEVYVKVYNKLGSKVKVVFTDIVGARRDTIFVTSYLTSASTAHRYCHGLPLYIRE